MKRELSVYPDPVLAKRAKEIEEVTPEIRQLAEDMAETMYNNDGIGLAAPQVGESIRLVTIDLTGPEKREELRVLVNPVIIAKGDGVVETEEGCLSVANYRAKVRRASEVTVEATDLDGNPVTIEGEDLMAVCLQHEIDHLQGTLFIDHISRLKRAMYDKKVKKWIRQKERADMA